MPSIDASAAASAGRASAEANGAPVSVVIAARNAASTVGATIASLASDRAIIREILLVDDASSDDTTAAARRAAEGVRLPITILRAERLGPGAARNIGLASAGGCYVFFLDADDQVEEGGLTALVAALRSSPAAGVAIGQYTRRTAGRPDRLRLPSDLYTTDRAANAGAYLTNRLRTIQIGSGLVRRVALDGIGFPDNLAFEEDVLFWAAVLSRSTLVTVSRRVVIYNVDEARALVRHTTAARQQFLRISLALRALAKHGVSPHAIRWRRRWVAYRIARAFIRLGNVRAARPFIRVASTSPAFALRLGRLRVHLALARGSIRS
jgi:glycosyltransferase involved in cell wall biosynthesis